MSHPRPPRRRLTSCICLGFNIAGSYLPIILNNRNVSTGQNTVYDTYKQYLIIYSPGVIGCVLAMLAIQLPVLGRKVSLWELYAIWRRILIRLRLSGPLCFLQRCKVYRWLCTRKSGTPQATLD